MENKNRLIEIPSDGIIRIPTMCGNDTVGEKRIDLSHYPTVDTVEVVHGEWRLGKFNCGRETVFAECSVCDAVFEVSSFSLNLNYNYCPNCGAKMDGGNEDD